MPTLSRRNKVSFSLPVFAFPLSLDRLVLCIQKDSSKENQKKAMLLGLVKYFDKILCKGLVRESNRGPLAPKARIMSLDQQARYKRRAWVTVLIYKIFETVRAFSLVDGCV